MKLMELCVVDGGLALLILSLLLNIKRTIVAAIITATNPPMIMSSVFEITVEGGGVGEGVGDATLNA